MQKAGDSVSAESIAPPITAAKCRYPRPSAAWARAFRSRASWERRLPEAVFSMCVILTWMEARQGNYLFPYWATAYLGTYHLAICLAVQRPCCYGRAAQFYSDYLAILPCCSSPQGSCHCACSLTSFPICHAPWGRLQDNIHIWQVGQHSQIRHMLTYMVYSD